MKSRLLVSLSFVAVVSSSTAQTPVTPPPAPAGETSAVPALSEDERTKVLQEITKVQREFSKTKKDLLVNALDRFRTGVGSDGQAQEFYLACYKLVNMDRKPPLTKAEAEERVKGEWQKKAAAELGEGAVTTVLRMQLQLLVMMIESAKGKPVDESVAALRTYMKGVIAFLPGADETPEQPGARRPVATVAKKGQARKDDDRGGRKRNGAEKLLKQNVMKTLFADAYNLAAYLESPGNWPESVADFRGAYLGVILPWYRANRKAELPAVWDEYIKAETTLRELTLSAEQFADWAADDYKDIYWAKWIDLLRSQVTAGAAVQELVKTVRENPSHRSLKNWIGDLAKVGENLGGLKFEDAPQPPPSR